MDKQDAKDLMEAVLFKTVNPDKGYDAFVEEQERKKAKEPEGSEGGEG